MQCGVATYYNELYAYTHTVRASKTHHGDTQDGNTQCLLVLLRKPARPRALSRSIGYSRTPWLGTRREQHIEGKSLTGLAELGALRLLRVDVQRLIICLPIRTFLADGSHPGTRDAR
eukprot:1231694-Pyramimonas_sp.AAC.1